ncbi:MAG: histidine phosphatase family protein [Polyangiales bacterium]
MSVVYLIRHGQGSFGTDNYDQLSTLGREQCRLLGLHFAELGERIDALYSGALQRQRETADLLAEGLASTGAARLAVTVDASFDEYEGDVILKEYADSLTEDQLKLAGWPSLQRDRRRFQLFLEQAAAAWADGRILGEASTAFKLFHGRVVGALRGVMQREGRGKTVAISTSGGVIGTLVAHVLGASEQTGIQLNWAVHNASITRLIYSEEKVSLSMFNALPHLDRSDRKQLVTYR